MLAGEVEALLGKDHDVSRFVRNLQRDKFTSPPQMYMPREDGDAQEE